MALACAEAGGFEHLILIVGFPQFLRLHER